MKPPASTRSDRSSTPASADRCRLRSPAAPARRPGRSGVDLLVEARRAGASTLVRVSAKISSMPLGDRGARLGVRPAGVGAGRRRCSRTAGAHPNICIGLGAAVPTAGAWAPAMTRCSPAGGKRRAPVGARSSPPLRVEADWNSGSFDF